jgi:hypothetical protein
MENKIEPNFERNVVHVNSNKTFVTASTLHATRSQKYHTTLQHWPWISGEEGRSELAA